MGKSRKAKRRAAAREARNLSPESREFSPSMDDPSSPHETMSAVSTTSETARRDSWGDGQDVPIVDSQISGKSAKDGFSPEKSENNTVLQKHIQFWDRDRDGVIRPWDTFFGFRDLGFGFLFCLVAVVVIHFVLSYPTRLTRSWFPDPLWRVYLTGVRKVKPDSGSGAQWQGGGRFDEEAFNARFSQFDKTGWGFLTGRELWRMVRSNRGAWDLIGWLAATLEFVTAWVLLQKEGRVSKEDLRGVYDGSVFWRVKEARESGDGWRKGFSWPNLVNLSKGELAPKQEMDPGK